MTAEFYLVPASFENNKNLSKSEIEEKVKSLAQDFVLIKHYKDTDKIFTNPEIYSVVFLGNATISDLLHNPAVHEKLIDRDVWRALLRIIDESANTESSTEDIIELLLPNHNENVCYGLIAFNEIAGIGCEYQVVYSINDWYNFRRYFLGLYPGNGDFFIEESKKYFPKLFFHERNKKTVSCVLKDCSKRIVYHLTALNDKFDASCLPGFNRTQVLDHFSLAAKLDEMATLEGNAARKKDFSFEFINEDGKSENICCDPHIKLCYNDGYPGDSSYSTDRRIYFHEGKPNIEQGKILIGHIGRHL